jgi:Ca2+/Na+ antiporter
MHLSQIPAGPALILLAGGAIYVASRSAVGAVIGPRPATGGRLAVGLSLPTFIVAIWAAATGHGDVAMNIVFGTAVGGLLLAGGAAVLLLPPSVTRGVRLLWSMLVPVGLIAFVIGFQGALTSTGAVVLLVEGAIIFVTAQSGPEEPAVDPSVDTSDVARHDSGPWGSAVRWGQLLFAAGLAGEAGWLAMKGIGTAHSETARLTPGFLATTILCPLLILPAVGFSTDLAQRGKTAEVLQAAIWNAAGNICLLAPLLLAVTRIAFLFTRGKAYFQSLKLETPIPLPDLIFPVTTWRIDVLFITATGLFLLPVAVGRWPLTKWHGLAMTAAYGLYLFLPIYMATLAHR